jgi:hypothetical protein
MLNKMQEFEEIITEGTLDDPSLDFPNLCCLSWDDELALVESRRLNVTQSTALRFMQGALAQLIGQVQLCGMISCN